MPDSWWPSQSFTAIDAKVTEATAHNREAVAKLF